MSIITADKIASNMVIAYTDGACVGNGSKNAVGGVGVFIPSTNRQYSFRVVNTTNNQCELLAILYALYTLQDIKKPICIMTDSEYSMKSVCVWYTGWQRSGKKYANKELIDLIHKVTTYTKVYFCHVRAHTNKTDIHSLGNHTVDQLAESAASNDSAELIDMSFLNKFNSTKSFDTVDNVTNEVIDTITNEIVETVKVQTSTNPHKHKKNKQTTLDSFDMFVSD
jgi:ribonuclease HI